MRTKWQEKREKGRKKIEKEKVRKRALKNVLEFGGSGREKRGKKERKKRVRVRRRRKEGKKEGNMVRVWRRKKEEKKEEENMDKKIK